MARIAVSSNKEGVVSIFFDGFDEDKAPVLVKFGGRVTIEINKEIGVDVHD